jgi:hypothetical protein
MSLLTIAEILSGEAKVSPSGPVDTETAASSVETPIWGPAHAEVLATRAETATTTPAAPARQLVPVGAS